LLCNLVNDTNNRIQEDCRELCRSFASKRKVQECDNSLASCPHCAPTAHAHRLWEYAQLVLHHSSALKKTIAMAASSTTLPFVSVRFCVARHTFIGEVVGLVGSHPSIGELFVGAHVHTTLRSLNAHISILCHSLPLYTICGVIHLIFAHHRSAHIF
jgi:hypothetical protein